MVAPTTSERTRLVILLKASAPAPDTATFTPKPPDRAIEAAAEMTLISALSAASTRTLPAVAIMRPVLAVETSFTRAVIVREMVFTATDPASDTDAPMTPPSDSVRETAAATASMAEVSSA